MEGLEGQLLVGDLVADFAEYAGQWHVEGLAEGGVVGELAGSLHVER